MKMLSLSDGPLLVVFAYSCPCSLGISDFYSSSFSFSFKRKEIIPKSWWNCGIFISRESVSKITSSFFSWIPFLFFSHPISVPTPTPISASCYHMWKSKINNSVLPQIIMIAKLLGIYEVPKSLLSTLAHIMSFKPCNNTRKKMTIFNPILLVETVVTLNSRVRVQTLAIWSSAPTLNHSACPPSRSPADSESIEQKIFVLVTQKSAGNAFS